MFILSVDFMYLFCIIGCGVVCYIGDYVFDCDEVVERIVECIMKYCRVFGVIKWRGLVRYLFMGIIVLCFFFLFFDYKVFENWFF